MTGKKIITLSFCSLIACGLSLSSSCAKRNPVAKREVALKREAPLPPVKSTPTPAPTSTPTAMPPQPAEVREKIARVYQKTVVLSAEDDRPFISGDFNGDGSQDLMAVVKPADGRLIEINRELANWIIRDLHPGDRPATSKVNMPHPMPKTTTPLRPTTVTADDILVAVIHGYGRDGWRTPEAHQTFLLRNAAGSKIHMESMASLLGSTKNKRKLPPIQGDVIMEQIAGEEGILYWTGSKYAWYSFSSPQS